MAKLKARADTEEPGTLDYQVVRSGDRFAVWERYVPPPSPSALWIAIAIAIANV